MKSHHNQCYNQCFLSRSLILHKTGLRYGKTPFLKSIEAKLLRCNAAAQSTQMSERH